LSSWCAVFCNCYWDPFIDSFRSIRVHRDEDQRHRSLEAQTSIGGMTRVLGRTAWPRLALLALLVWPKCSRSCISIKNCIKNNPMSFEFAKVPKSEKYEKRGFFCSGEL
jgi:hypothetical protein